MNKYGPTPRPTDQLRLTAVKVFFSHVECADLDVRRGHYSRAAFLRAAGLSLKLMAAPLPAAIQTWADSARIQSCLTQINQHANLLNSMRIEMGSEFAAVELLNRSSEVLTEFKEFRLILADLTGQHNERN